MAWLWGGASRCLNYTNVSFNWIVLSSSGTGFGIGTFANRLVLYTGSSSGLFGLDNFGLAIISFLFIFLFTGIVSYKFGITSPAAISALVFSLVLFLDVGLGILKGVRFVGAENIPVATILIGIIVIVAGLLKEAYQ